MGYCTADAGTAADDVRLSLSSLKLGFGGLGLALS
jgi:hypothetical protein